MFANSNMMVRRLPSRAGREKLILGILQKKKGGRSFSGGKDTLLQSGSDWEVIRMVFAVKVKT